MKDIFDEIRHVLLAGELHDEIIALRNEDDDRPLFEIQTMWCMQHAVTFKLTAPLHNVLSAAIKDRILAIDSRKIHIEYDMAAWSIAAMIDLIGRVVSKGTEHDGNHRS